MTVRCRRWTDTNGKVLEAWFVDIVFEHANGRVERIRKKSPIQTRRGAEQYEREVRQALLSGTYNKQEEKKRVPVLVDFAKQYLTYAKVNNKPSTYDAKLRIMERHLIPAFGRLPLDRIGAYEVEAFKAAKLESGITPKTINNILTVLGRMFSLAVEWGSLQRVPPMKWLKAPRPTFDFLSFDEADRLAAAADVEWRVMITLALNSGLRRGELLALRWEDVDLVAGRLMVRRNVWRGHYGTPKGGRTREIPLNEKALQVLRAHRHLRGELVFCKESGKPLSNLMCRSAIIRACKKAGLRHVGWHTLRHTFASHLVMRGVPLKVVQELLGHATVEMTLRYAHLSPEVTRDAVKVLDRCPPECQTQPICPFSEEA